MEVTFATSKLYKLCNSAKNLRGEYGSRQAGIIQQRLFELAAAPTLADMFTVVGAHCHPLTQNLKGLYAVYLVHPDRLAFKPCARSASPQTRQRD